MTIADHNVARRALAELLSIGGYDAAEATERVAITPEDIALDTRFHIQEASAAALAAGGFVAAKLLDKQGSVHVATRHAEASLQSYHHVRFDNPDKQPVARSATPGRDLIAGFQRTADGRWMYIHPSFEANTLALLELFGHPQDADAARRAIGQWDAPDLERTIWERGLCSAMLRTADEWDACEQGQILNALPVVEIIQIGDAPPRPHEPGDRPLDGYKVLDLTRVLAGPTCARTLTSYGAQALRVAGEGLPHVPQFVAETGMGKRSAYIDLKSADGKTTLNGLVAESDVFSQGYRSGALERLGFGVQDVVAMHPGIVYVSINCFGHEGPWRHLPGWEQLGQTVTGMAHAHGNYHNDGEPELQPAAVNDYTTGYLAAYGALVALLRQRNHGGSYWVRVSLSRTCKWIRNLGERGQVSTRSFTDDEIAALRVCTDTHWGPMHHLKPAVSMSAAEVFWKRPPVPLGSHPAAFS